MKRLFNERYREHRKRLFYPRPVESAGGLSPEFIRAYVMERKRLKEAIGANSNKPRKLNEADIDRWISKALTFEKLND